MYLCIECKQVVSVRLDTKQNGTYESDPHPSPGIDDKICTGRARDPEIWEMIKYHVHQGNRHTGKRTTTPIAPEQIKREKIERILRNSPHFKPRA